MSRYVTPALHVTLGVPSQFLHGQSLGFVGQPYGHVCGVLSGHGQCGTESGQGYVLIGHSWISLSVLSGNSMGWFTGQPTCGGFATMRLISSSVPSYVMPLIVTFMFKQPFNSIIHQTTIHVKIVFLVFVKLQPHFPTYIDVWLRINHTSTHSIRQSILDNDKDSTFLPFQQTHLS